MVQRKISQDKRKMDTGLVVFPSVLQNKNITPNLSAIFLTHASLVIVTESKQYKHQHNYKYIKIQGTMAKDNR